MGAKQNTSIDNYDTLHLAVKPNITLIVLQLYKHLQQRHNVTNSKHFSYNYFWYRETLFDF